MSKKPKPATLGKFAPLIWADTFGYNIANGLVKFEFGDSGMAYNRVAMTLDMAIELHQKLGNSIAEVLRAPYQGGPEGNGETEAQITSINGEPLQ